MTFLSRRRFLTISAACAALPKITGAAPSAHWNGVALGAPASLRLEGLTYAQAAPIIAAVETELERLENIFSLYRPQSQLSRLNANGVLRAPAPELLRTMSLCSSLHAASDGAFDPTVQPVWLALARRADPPVVAAAQKTIGWRRVYFGSDKIQLAIPGTSALTLNGIAQGVVTDHIAALLRTSGLRDVLVNMGEIAALGQHRDGQKWRVGLSDPDGVVLKSISLRDRAVATSSTHGMQFADGQGHILNPNDRTLKPRTVSVSAPQAGLADGLSTALCAAPTSQVASILSCFPSAKLELNA